MNDKLCRLCLAKENLSVIFKDLKQSAAYSRVLKLTTGLRIAPNDGLPQYICTICIDLVKMALSLRNQSQLSEKKLKQAGHRLIETSHFSENEMSEETADIKWPVVKNENNEMYDLKLEHVDTNSKSNNLNLEFGTDLKTNSTRQLKEKVENREAIVECELPETNQAVFLELKNVEAMADSKQPGMSKKAKRAMYMELVEGVFDPKGPVKCKVCKKTVSKWACFVSHAKLHLGFKFVCEFCGKSFISSTQLKRHCRSWHGMPRQLRCQHCSYLALDAPQLLLHERRTHTGERPYVCDACAARYHSRRCLLQHLESHRTTREVQCPDCPTLVKSRRHLARHRYSAHCSRRIV